MVDKNGIKKLYETYAVVDRQGEGVQILNFSLVFTVNEYGYIPIESGVVIEKQALIKAMEEKGFLLVSEQPKELIFSGETEYEEKDLPR